LTTEAANGEISYTDAMNDNIRIHNNSITMNGGLGGAGGGVSICTGSDNYSVNDNYICGNFTLGNGGGIGHIGLSNNGLIARNKVLFNESFNQGMTVHGGGIFVGGGAPVGGPGSLSPGAGQVKVIANLIQGNLAGAGDGGGIRTSRVNGQDVEAKKNDPEQWTNMVEIYNNMVINNVAAFAGGGISLFDTARSNIIHNTVAHNDSTATAGEAFTPGNPNTSNPQPAGVVSRAHSPELTGVIGNGRRARAYKYFSNPFEFVDNIIWENRSFYFTGNPEAVPPVPYGLQPDPATPVFWDLGVLGYAGALNPTYSVLTDPTGYSPTNTGTPPSFVLSYFNGGRGLTVVPGEPTTALQAPAAFDEGGNFIKVRFGPLTRCDDGNPGDGDPGPAATTTSHPPP
jgi:large repetitive protein